MSKNNSNWKFLKVISKQAVCHLLLDTFASKIFYQILLHMQNTSIDKSYMLNDWTLKKILSPLHYGPNRGVMCGYWQQNDKITISRHKGHPSQPQLVSAFFPHNLSISSFFKHPVVLLKSIPGPSTGPSVYVCWPALGLCLCSLVMYNLVEYQSKHGRRRTLLGENMMKKWVFFK